MITTSVTLNDHQLALLNGKLDEKQQKLVESAIARLHYRQIYTDLLPNLSDFICDLREIANAKGLLTYSHCKLRSCRICDIRPGYHTVARTTKYKKKGQIDYDSPIYLYGRDFASGFIVWEGSPNLGCCDSCLKQHSSTITKHLSDIKAELPQELTGVPSKYKRWDNMQCSCGWTGHEGQMGKLQTLMGNGYYPGKCPNCKAENLLFSREIKKADGFVVVEAFNGEDSVVRLQSTKTISTVR